MVQYSTPISDLANQLISNQISVENPVGVEVVNSIQNLVEQRLHHALGHLYWRLLATLYSSVELYDVLWNVQVNERLRRNEERSKQGHTYT